MTLWFTKAAGGMSPGAPPAPKGVPRGEGCAGCADSAAHTLCKRRQLLPQPLFAQPALLCLPLGSRWKEMAFGPENEARQLQAPASRILQLLPRLLSSCLHPPAPSKLKPPQSSRNYRKMHSPQHKPAATARKIIYYHFLATEIWGKKSPTLHRCKQQQLQHPRWDLCTSQCKVHRGKKNSIQVLKKPQNFTT